MPINGIATNRERFEKRKVYLARCRFIVGPVEGFQEARACGKRRLRDRTICKKHDS